MRTAVVASPRTNYGGALTFVTWLTFIALEFASCAVNRTFSATWKCRQQRLAMNTCMIQYATREEQDRSREEWFATRDDRKREKEEKEAKRKLNNEFHKEWWNLVEAEKRRGKPDS